MIRGMEDTLVELKAACAGVMAETKKIQRQRDEADDRARFWAGIELAATKGRYDLAREALVEKRRYRQRADSLEQELSDHQGLVEQYQNDIRQLEDKLKTARDKQRVLVHRHVHAERKRRAQEEIRRIYSAEAVFRFDELESRIEAICAAEADLVNFGRKGSLEEELETLTVDEDIERELLALKDPHPGDRKSA